jgi:hypothetical protein
MIDWRPIETAPKDGTTVLLWFPDFRRKCWIGEWIEKEEKRNGVITYRSAHWVTGLSLSLWNERPDPSHWAPVNPPATAPTFVRGHDFGIEPATVTVSVPARGDQE